MLVSFRWLARHVNLDGIDPEQLAADLTLSTAEVEGVLPFAPQLSDVVVGEVSKREAHPDADKLSVCAVDVGDGEPLGIVCGAPNVAAGQKVAVAKVGTVLPGDFKIKKARIRGVDSRGMICSLRELDIGDEHEGIWVLPDEAEVGRPVDEALGLEDWVIEIDNKSLTHRPDLWGHRGIAGELAAIYRRELAPLDLALPATGRGSLYPVRVESPACSRYLGLLIEGARAEPSPDWMRWLLLAVGQRPIDAIVDLSNFVMLDLGQPNHAFDASRLSAEGINVRNAREGEHITTLDGEDRALVASDLLICSGDEPVALAGIMGGEASKVGEDTSRLLLEIASFDAPTIRRTATRLGLRTDSSSRFEKTLDPTLPMKAAAHFAKLLQEMQPDVELPAPISDAGDWNDPALELRLRPARVRAALGADVPDDEVVDILTRIGFGVERDGDALRVAVPSARAAKDVTLEQDLIEEVGRIHRYGSVPERVMLAEVAPPPPDRRRDLVRTIQDRLAGSARFHEVLSYSFHDERLLAQVGEAERPHVRVENPVTPEESSIRRSILPSLLARIEPNRRHRDDVRLFEIGKGYRPEDADEQGQAREVHEAALVWAGPPLPADAPFDENRMSRLYGVVTDLVANVGHTSAVWARAESPPAWAHPTRCLAATSPKSDEPIALVGALEPGLARALGLEGELESDVAAAAISIDALFDLRATPGAYRAIPRFPGVKLDVAIDAPEATPAADLLAAIEQAGKGQVADAHLFDLYRGESLGAGRKSLAYHLVLQSDQKTLTDKDQARFLTRLEKALEKLDARLRR